jgi:hypothetical protein
MFLWMINLLVCTCKISHCWGPMPVRLVLRMAIGATESSVSPQFDVELTETLCEWSLLLKALMCAGLLLSGLLTKSS